MAASDQPVAWMVTVSTMPGTTHSSDVLKPFSESLGSAPSLDPVNGILRATMVVEESEKTAAVDAAAKKFRDAMERVGLPVPGGLELQVKVEGAIPASALE